MLLHYLNVFLNLDNDSVVFQIQLFSTWGDPYYVGLNGLEFYNARQEKIPLTKDSKFVVEKKN